MPMETLAAVLPGHRRGRRRRLGVPLSAAVGRAAGGEAQGERREARSARCARRRRRTRQDRPEGAPRAGRRHAQGARAAAEEGQEPADLGAHLAGRALLVEAPVHHHQRGLRRRRGGCRLCDWGSACWSRSAWVRGRLRPAALAAGVPQEAARERASSTSFRTRSTSSCAASRPACRCSTA